MNLTSYGDMSDVIGHVTILLAVDMIITAVVCVCVSK